MHKFSPHYHRSSNLAAHAKQLFPSSAQKALRLALAFGYISLLTILFCLSVKSPFQNEFRYCGWLQRLKAVSGCIEIPLWGIPASPSLLLSASLNLITRLHSETGSKGIIADNSMEYNKNLAYRQSLPTLTSITGGV